MNEKPKMMDLSPDAAGYVPSSISFAAPNLPDSDIDEWSRGEPPKVTGTATGTIAAPNAAPEWKLVPVEPTQDMLYAMAEHDGHKRGDRDHPGLTRWEDYWSAAIAAAPNLPDSETRESVEAIMALADEYGMRALKVDRGERPCDISKYRAALRAAIERVIQGKLAAEHGQTVAKAACLALGAKLERAEQEAAELRALWFADADPRETKYAKAYAVSASSAIDGKP